MGAITYVFTFNPVLNLDILQKITVAINNVMFYAGEICSKLPTDY